MSFAQLTYRESLRDIESCLNAMKSKLYHMGIRGHVCRSTLAYTNEQRNWRIYADFAGVLIQKARRLYAGDSFGVDLDKMVYALDATIIDLCLSLFPWAQFRKRKSAIKLHTLLDLHGSIPIWVKVTSASVHEVNLLDELIPEAGSFYVMDRGYLDFRRLFAIHAANAFFIIRSKRNTQFQRLYSHPVNKTTGLRCDQTGYLTTYYSSKDYPEKIRRIKYYDAEHKLQLVFMTNNFSLPPLIIAQIYKCRWLVELFFKWIKTHLRIKAFYGTSENAVKTQIWIAITVYVLVAIVRKELKLDMSLYSILQILSVSLFEKQPIYQILTDFKEQPIMENPDNQLNLFNF
jgi:transposase